jgi:hypothetical protein
MMQLRLIVAAGLTAVGLAACADDGRIAATPTTTTTTTRDYWGNPVSQTTTARDAYGNPVYSGSSTAPAAVAPGTRDCRATWLHQDRPGGSDYVPGRGYDC